MLIQKERLLSTFLEYIEIDSESTHEGAMAGRLAAIGCQVERDASQAQTGSETDNLYCTLPGTVPGEAVVLLAHTDAVVPGRGIEPVIRYGVIFSRGGTPSWGR